MNEQMKRHYKREEEFIDAYHDIAYEAAKMLGKDWTPDPFCDDAKRQNTKYFQDTGELTALVFDSASVFHDASGFSSAEIALKSSTRIVAIRVRKTANGFAADTPIARSEVVPTMKCSGGCGKSGPARQRMEYICPTDGPQPRDTCNDCGAKLEKTMRWEYVCDDCKAKISMTGI